jgi:hypothetical protein
LSIGIVVCSTFAISACTESNQKSEYIPDRVTESSVSNEEPNLTEYIIVLEKDVSIESATGILKKYEVQVIRDLKKDRYLIGLKNDPGIERLKKDVEGSGYIKYIQPNFTYTIQ